MTSLKHTLVLGFIVFSSVYHAQAQSVAEASNYMSRFSKENETISNAMWDYISAAAHSKSRRIIDNRRKSLIGTILTAEKRVSSMECLNSDCLLRDSTAGYFHLSYLVLNEDFEKLLNMEEIAEQSYDLMEAYLLAKEKVDEKMDSASREIDAQYRKFAARYKVPLQEKPDKLALKLQKASQVFDYRNKVFLLFFKGYKQEAYLLSAWEKNDLAAMEQNADMLKTFSDNGLAVLDTMKAYKGDGSLRLYCTQMLTFYRKEAAENIPFILDFTLKKEEFEKVAKELEAKPQMVRTKEDVELYNKLLKEYNTGSIKYNAMIKQMNSDRSRILNAWNNAEVVFLQRHIPQK
ncbi:MAG: hypothetical protein U0T82_05870 [Bacteroidales bacterium]